MEITSDQMVAFAAEALGLSDTVGLELSQLAGRGSDRTYFRLKWNDRNSAILVRYNPKRVENTYFAHIALFLHDIQVSAPRLMQHEAGRCLILMEDLGDADLWSLRHAPWETRAELYRKTLAIAHRLHSFPAQRFPSERVLLMDAFGPDLYRWERDYFAAHFVNGVCGVELPSPMETELERELCGLADRLGDTTTCLLHRDLQSQNVMVREGNPFLIDFQGMRFGSPFYDLGSLLCDPYVDFSDSEREELLSFYYALAPEGDCDWPTFQQHFWEAAAQRLMQALGAYGFLGLKKGLKAYLDHIPAGLRNLLQAAEQARSLPRLLEVTELCRKALEER